MPKGVNEPWYVAVPVGKNVLAKMVPEMCSEAGIAGRKTNHSLHVSGASSLFDAGVPERIIQQRTGHRSIEGLRAYERVTDDQEKAVSKILTGECSKFDECCKTDQDLKQMDQVAGIGAQYNNCTFYSTPAAPYPYPPSHFWPPVPNYMLPPYPLSYNLQNPPVPDCIEESGTSNHSSD